MDTSSSSTPSGDAAPTRALVLGGGGSTGNAWLIGIVSGLSDAGLDVTSADLTVGTSAGATAAAQLAGETPAALFAAATASTRTPATTSTTATTAARTAPTDDAPRRGPSAPVTDHLARISAVIDSAEDAADMRRRMGAAAMELDAASDGSWSAQWRTTVAARLPVAHWPERTIRLAAVDARTGDPVVFDRRSEVDLVDAVAASCASGLPYAIGDGRYIDGGYRRNENADLATGYQRVLVLSPLGGRTLHPLEWGMQLAAQADELRAGGSRVETVVPGADAEHLFGAHAMNPSLRPAAAHAGYDQGRALAGRLGGFWR